VQVHRFSRITLMSTVTISLTPEQADAFRRLVPVDIYPDALYSAAQASLILGFTGKPKSRINRMYEIPTSELPQLRMGPAGGIIRWLGRDLLAYREARRIGGNGK
jgi:hypothetical protein